MTLAKSLSLGLLALLAVAAPVSAQQQDARADGKSFGESLRGEAQGADGSDPGPLLEIQGPAQRHRSLADQQRLEIP